MFDVKNYTKEDFLNAPDRLSWREPVYCRSLVLVPTDYEHDSGFLCMDLVALDENGEIICKCAGGSDVLHFNGIGGYGDYNVCKKHLREGKVPIAAWSMDLLPCGYFRIMLCDKIKIGEALSDVSIFSKGYY